MNKPKLIIVRGLPGSGKSTLARKILAELRERGYNAEHMESDSFFIGDDGVYRFNQAALGAAHKICFEKVQAAIEANQIAIVSNTFTMQRELNPYLKLTDNVFVVTVNKHLTLEENFKRTIHGVPMEALQRMKDRWVSHPGEFFYDERADDGTGYSDFYQEYK